MNKVDQDIKEYFFKFLNKRDLPYTEWPIDELRYYLEYRTREDFSEANQDEIIEQLETLDKTDAYDSKMRIMDEDFQRYHTQYGRVTSNKWFLISTLIISIIGILLLSRYGELENLKETSELDRRLTQIDNAKVALENTIQFLQDQERAINETQSILETLKNERIELEPIVNAEREVIEQIFTQQEKRFNKRKWINLIQGFLIGIITSILGTFIYERFFKRTQKEN